MKNNLIVIARSFPSEDNKYLGGIFVREQLKSLSKYYAKIYVLVPNPIVYNLFDLRKYCKNYSIKNIEIFYVNYLLIPRFFYNLRLKSMVFAIRNLIAKKNIKGNFILCHFTEPSGFIAYELQKKFNYKYGIVIHENNDWLNLELAKKDFFGKIWSNASLLFRVNKNTISKLKEFNKNVFELKNGYDSELFSYYNKKIVLRKELGLPIDKKIIIYISFFSSRKNQKLLVDFMSKNINNKNLFCLLIGSENNYSKILKKYIIDNHIDYNTKILHIDRIELPKWLNVGDIFAFPSKKESFGIVQVEAMACGLPVVAMNNGGSEEIILNSKLGVLSNSESDFLTKLQKAIYMSWDNNYIANYTKTNYSYDKLILELYTKIKKYG